eukprot:snap_masked-scaffold_32-processed-gene-0.9-mRNA-1 protein AED:1.00 eAED:1.00 QI:0/-1/0/0/-1/1/1/0/385
MLYGENLMQKIENWKVEQLSLLLGSTLQLPNKGSLTQSLTILTLMLKDFEISSDFLKHYSNLEKLTISKLISVPEYDGETTCSSIKQLNFDGGFGLFIPDGFLNYFPNLQHLILQNMDYFECEESFRKRTKLLTNYSYKTDQEFSTCIYLDGSVDLTLYKNNFCTVPQKYQAFENLIRSHKSYHDTFDPLPISCLPPFFFEDVEISFKKETSISFFPVNLNKMSPNAFKSRNGSSLFPLVTSFSLTSSFFRFHAGILGKESFPNLQSIRISGSLPNKFSPQMFLGNENQLTSLQISLAEVNNEEFFKVVVSQLVNLQEISISSSFLNEIPSIISSLSELKMLQLFSVKIYVIGEHSICAEDGSSKLESFVFINSLDVIFEDRVFE